jgi:ribosome maturation protein Sdo1
MTKIRSEFTDLENAVLDGFISSSGRMGISSISKNIINPKTGKPYTRMAASLAWKKIKNKIKMYKGAA